MQRITLSRAILALALAFAAAPAPAGPRGDEPPPRAGLRPGRAEVNPEEMRKSLALFFLHKLRTELDLKDEQMLRLLPVVERIEESRAESHKRRGEIARRLEELASDPASGEGEVQAQIRALDLEEERLRADQLKLRDEAFALLLPWQRARFVTFSHRFRGMVEKQLQGMQGGPRPRPGRFDGRDMEPKDPPPDQR